MDSFETVLESFLSPALEGATTDSVKIFKDALAKVKEARTTMKECEHQGDYAGAAKAARSAAKLAKGAQSVILKLDPDLSSTALTDLGIMVGTMLFSACVNGRTWLSSSSKKSLPYGAYDEAVSKARGVQASRVKQIAANRDTQLSRIRDTRHAGLREANALKKPQSVHKDIALRQYNKANTLWKESYKMELEAEKEFRENVEKFYAENMTNREKLIASVHPLKILSHTIPQVAPLVAFIQTAQKKKLLMTSGDPSLAHLNANDFNLVIDCIKNMLQGITDRYLRLAEDHEREVEYLKRRDDKAALESALNCAMCSNLSISTKPLTQGEGPYPTLIPLYDLAVESTLLHVAIENEQCEEATAHAANCVQICHDLAMENDSPEARLSLASAQSQFYATESTLMKSASSHSEEKRDNYLEALGEIGLECLLQDLDREMDEVVLESQLAVAMEGTNIDAIKSWREHRKMIAGARKEMKAAAKGKNYELAAEKASECAKYARMLVDDINNLPDSTPSAVLVNMAIQLIAFYIGNKAVGKIMGHQAKKTDRPNPIEFIKGKRAKVEYTKQQSTIRNTTSKVTQKVLDKTKVSKLGTANMKENANWVRRQVGRGVDSIPERTAQYATAQYGALGISIAKISSGFAVGKALKAMANKANGSTRAEGEEKANDSNALLNALKIDANRLVKKFEKKAAEYRQAARNGHATTEAAENFLALPIEQALEGATFDFLGSYFKHWRDLQRARKEMYEAAKAARYEIAKAKAFECCDIAVDMKRDLAACSDEANKCTIVVQLAIATAMFMIKTVQMYQFFRADNLNKATKLEQEVARKYPGKFSFEIPEADAICLDEARVLRNEPSIAAADAVVTAGLIQAIDRPANRLSRAFALLHKKKVISSNGSVDTSTMQERDGNEILKEITADVEGMIVYFKEFAKYWDRRAKEVAYAAKRPATESWLFN